MTGHKAVLAASRAIYELDKASFANKTQKDQEDWDTARKKLFDIMQRNGYEFGAVGARQIRKIPKGART
jgi:hypothetical protein